MAMTLRTLRHPQEGAEKVRRKDKPGSGVYTLPCRRWRREDYGIKANLGYIHSKETEPINK